MVSMGGIMIAKFLLVGGLLVLGSQCAKDSQIDLGAISAKVTGCSKESIKISHVENDFSGLPETWTATCTSTEGVKRYRCTSQGKYACRAQ